MKQLFAPEGFVIVRLKVTGAGSNMFGLGVVLVFLAVGCVILGVIGRFAFAWGGFSVQNLKDLYFDNGEPSMIPLVFTIIGLGFVFMGLYGIWGIVGAMRDKGITRACIFDHRAQRFAVSQKKPEALLKAPSSAGLAGFAYDQIKGLCTRTFTVRSSSGTNLSDTAGSSTFSTSGGSVYHAVCLEKTDGALWDLFASTSRNEAEARLAELRALLDPHLLAQDELATPDHPGRDGNETLLPPGVRGMRTPGYTWFTWRIRARFGRLTFALLLMLSFMYIIVFAIKDALPVQIFAGLVVTIMLVVLGAGFRSSIVSSLNNHAVRVGGGKIATGLIPNGLLKVDKSFPAKDGFVTVRDAAEMAEGFVEKEFLALDAVRMVQYAMQFGMWESREQEIRLLTDAGAKVTVPELDSLKDLGNLVQAAQAMSGEVLVLRLEGLTVSQAMALESAIEQAIRQQGGTVV